MEASERIQGSDTSTSPDGQSVAFVVGNTLQICDVYNTRRRTELNFRIPPKEILAIKWSLNCKYVLLFSSKAIEIFDCHDDDHKVRIENGSGGIGRFASADFVAGHKLLTIWEFGKARIWDVSSGRTVEIGDVKTTCTGRGWKSRPAPRNGLEQLAVLSRSGAEDILHVYLPASNTSLQPVKLRTMDAQSLSWSPDGRWIAVLDTPAMGRSNVHFHTANGHYFRSHSAAPDELGLGVKAVVWSKDGQRVALTYFDGKVELLDTRTFRSLVVLQYKTPIEQELDQSSTTVLQEVVSARNERSYSRPTLPIAPPLSKAKAAAESCEVGVAEARFNSSSTTLATQDERMLNTLWLWDANTFEIKAVLIQHSAVRRFQWHSSSAHLLMLDCGEGNCYLWNTEEPGQSPLTLTTKMPGSVTFTWLPGTSDTHASPMSILARDKTAFQLLHPYGCPADSREASPNPQKFTTTVSDPEVCNEDISEDSLLEVLTGRKPLPPRPEQQSYTEQVDAEVEAFESSEHLDDTFREKRQAKVSTFAEIDPFDDSQIF